MWKDYSGWEADIVDRRDAALSELDTNFKMGRGISAEAYTAERTRIQRESDAELSSLQSGPTYQMLRENYQASGSRASMDQFYGGRPATQSTPGSDLSEAGSSASLRRGVRTGVGADEGTSLLDRQQATWFFV